MRYSITPAIVLAGAVSLSACQEPEPVEATREFVVRVLNLTPSESLYATATFDTRVDGLESGPIGPNQSYSFEVVVHPGAQLQLITMLGESNDAFLAFEPGGIALWSIDGEPLDGERSSELVLYDAGTEVNEPLGEGESQPMRQAEPDTGEDEDGRITVITDGEGGAATLGDVEFPAIERFAELHVIHLGGPDFRVVLRNVSPIDLLAKPAKGKKGGVPATLSPGVYMVHEAGVEWFEVGERATPQLERLAEDGDPTPLAGQLEYLQGVASDFSGLVWAIHAGDVSLCNTGMPASEGLEDLVEDGRPEQLLVELETNEAIETHGLVHHRTDSPVIEPGEFVEFRFMASPGAHLGFVSGYLAGNDKFLGACDGGIPLFDQGGVPRSGELVWAVDLYDAGTELDEPPGLGANQFERQARSGAGHDEGEVVREVRGPWMGWEYPPAEQILSVQVEVSSTIPALPDDGIPNFP